MSYVSSSCPLPRNSLDPVTPCEADRARSIVSGVEQAVANARAASASIAAPQTFAQVGGVPLVVDVARQQWGLFSRTRGVDPVSLENILRVPEQVPLNVSEDDYYGCASRVIDLPTVTVPAPRVVMPPPAPVPKYITTDPVPSPAALSLSPGPPRYNNLCWAIRNGAVAASQFDPVELMNLQMKCSQLGYAGNCPAPPNTILWLAQNVNRLPHIPVPDSLLAAIPQAPMNIGACDSSYRLGGMSGFAWGDAGRRGRMCAPSQAQSKNLLAGSLAVLAFLGLAAYATGKRGRR